MSVTLNQLQIYLYDHIPLSTKVGVKVTQTSCHEMVLTFPLEPNINSQYTAFRRVCGKMAKKIIQ
jgi:hypothetical protein